MSLLQIFAQAHFMGQPTNMPLPDWIGPVVLPVPGISVPKGTESSGMLGSSVAFVLGMGRIVGMVVTCVCVVVAVVSSFPLPPQAHRERVRTSAKAIKQNFFIIILLFVLHR